MSNYLRRYLDRLPGVEECVVRNGDDILFTPIGIARYKERFARGGFDIARIDKWLAFWEAVLATQHIEFACLAEILKERLAQRKASGDADPLEIAMMEAHYADNTEELERICQKILHRRRAKLTPVPASPKVPTDTH